MNPPADLWAITSYYNPARFRRRLTNYRAFRRLLPIPLVAVELAYGADFELQPGDAEILVPLRGGDVMWQKERLLNLALTALPSECRKVVWMDCDLIIGSDDWPQRVGRVLDDFPLVQPFSSLCHLDADASLQEVDLFNQTAFSESSLAYAIHLGRPATAVLGWNKRREEGTIARGSVWAARRELLDAHGLFDACIVGGADTAIACAAYGDFDNVTRFHLMNERQRECYLAWAEPFFADVQAAVSWVEGPVFHLWHGSMNDRQYRQRHEGLQPFQFDPFQDIAIAENGVHLWNTAKPLLHRYVKDYLDSRKEDG